MASASSGLLRLAFRLASGKDLYMQAYPEPKPGARQRDLFAGVS
jgi:hypothetical protein